MKLSKVQIPSFGCDLDALFYSSDGQPSNVGIVWTHGFTSAKSSLDLVASYCANRGYIGLTHDLRGHKLGSTGGQLVNLGDCLHDIQTCANWLIKTTHIERVVLAGHSLGAILSIAAAKDIAQCCGVISVATGPKPTQGFRSAAGAAMLAQRSDYVAGADPREILEQAELLVSNSRIPDGIPTLFVAARNDLLVKVDSVRELANFASDQSEIIEVDAAHLDAPERARGSIANWLDRQFAS